MKFKEVRDVSDARFNIKRPCSRLLFVLEDMRDESASKYYDCNDVQISMELLSKGNRRFPIAKSARLNYISLLSNNKDEMYSNHFNYSQVIGNQDNRRVKHFRYIDLAQGRADVNLNESLEEELEIILDNIRDYKVTLYTQSFGGSNPLWKVYENHRIDEGLNEDHFFSNEHAVLFDVEELDEIRIQQGAQTHLLYKEELEAMAITDNDADFIYIDSLSPYKRTISHTHEYTYILPIADYEPVRAIEIENCPGLDILTLTIGHRAEGNKFEPLTNKLT